jgi:hypothetical protein
VIAETRIAWLRPAAVLILLLCAHQFGQTADAQSAAGRESAGERPGGRREAGFKTVGIYTGSPHGDQRLYGFYRASGYNYFEFCESGFGQRPDRLPAYYSEMKAAIDEAHREGFQVWILLLAGMKQWSGPAETGYPGTFSSLHADLLAERLGYIRQAVRSLKEADGFEFFAGDPGGDPEGRSTVRDCISFAGKVRDVARSEAPTAGFAVNLWAIAEWAGFPSPFSLDFWRKQALLSKHVAEEPDLLGPANGVVFSLDSYYRSLTFACFADAGIRPDPYPKAADVRRLRDRGVQPILGWPYFLVDEVDEGFIKPNNCESGGQAGAETRYIRALVDRGRAIGLDGLVANSAFVEAEALNIYAFGRMCRSPHLTPEPLLDEFAGLIADDATKRPLGQVLRFIENHSNWDNSLPPLYRLKPLRCAGITTAQIALDLLAKVRPRESPPIPLPEPPAAYLQRLRRRLEAIASGHVGGVAPIIHAHSRQN